jgi:hypothetical protein
VVDKKLWDTPNCLATSLIDPLAFLIPSSLCDRVEGAEHGILEQPSGVEVVLRDRAPAINFAFQQRSD